MARVYIETYGCALNRGDTSIMETVLASRGHVIVEDIDGADVVIINTCTVRMETEQRMIHRIRVLRKYCLEYGKKFIIAGCMAKAQPYLLSNIAPEASLVSPQNSSRIYLAVESSDRVILLTGDRDRSILGKCMVDRIAYVPIQDGCLGNCSFCIVKNARRKLVSYPIELVVDTVRELIDKGALEIEVTGQDTAVYGLDLYHKQALPELVREITRIPGDYMVRIGMMNPDTMYNILDDLVDVLKNPRVYKFLHIPVQSGSDKVLKIMRRRYTIDMYRSIIKELRRKVYGIAIATDIIVGHPGEDEEDFKATLDLLKELWFDRVHVARFTVRPNTYSASLPQINSRVVKNRLKRIMDVVESLGIRKHRRYVGRVVKAFVTEFNGSTYTGRMDNYTPVVFTYRDNLLGKNVKVLIKDCTFFDLRGDLLEYSC